MKMNMALKMKKRKEKKPKIINDLYIFAIN
jgi:hypothetical protein